MLIRYIKELTVKFCPISEKTADNLVVRKKNLFNSMDIRFLIQ